MELLIYTRRVNPRIEYIFRFIFKDILKLSYRITTSITEAQGYYGPLLSYSHQQIGKSVQVIPHGLLTETGVHHHSFEVTDWNGLPSFPLTAPDAEIPFDIFSASFYLLTRYEEYTSSRLNSDKHSRYSHLMSIASKNNFLHLPIIDLWAFRFLEILSKRGYSLTCKTRKFNHIVTFDLDSAYAFKHKGLVRVALSAIKSLVSGAKPDFIRRFKVLAGLKPDPFDIYDELIPILPSTPQTIWFIHSGSWGSYDKPIPIHSDAMKNLVQSLGEKFRIGIHPSYNSFLNENRTRDELAVLVDVLDQAVGCSRQHYLRLSLPTSYRILVKLGVTEDYTMGYSETIGFRAGTCTPFVFFDLLAEQPINLKVYPFQTMDSAMILKGMSADNAFGSVKQMIESVKNVNGTFVSVWHVDYLSGYQNDGDWFEVFKQTLSYLKEDGNGY